MSRYPLADVAALIGEPSRAAMLLALLDGSSLPASGLARAAGISAPAASLHLGKLTQGGLLRVRSEGRHRYYQLAHADVAHALEALGVIATAAPRTPKHDSPLRTARSCYDHLAGELSIALLAMFKREGFLVPAKQRAFDIGEDGVRFLRSTFSIDVAALETQRRPLTRVCLDLTERKDHLAGSLGAALLAHMLQRRWLARLREGRALRMTPTGELAFSRMGVRVG